jgi:predicted flap endonuclease-1-like 5' DNA nuclease
MTDDLTTIKGIGAGRAQMLIDEFGVQTWADLAALDPDAIVAALRRRRQVLSRQAAALWIAEAERRSQVRSDGWETAALFIVYYERRGAERRTAARRVDTDTDAQWIGYTTTEMAAWVERQLAATPASSDATPDAAEPDTAEPATQPAKLITAMRLFDPPDAVAPRTLADDGNFHHSVDSDTPFAIELATHADIAVSDLGVQTRSVGEHPRQVDEWRQLRSDADARTAWVVVDGLAGQQQAGPLLLIE